MAAARWLDRAPADWERLVHADPGASPGMRPALWEALVAASAGAELRLAVVEERGVLVGGVPVLLARRGPFRWLHALPMLLPAAPLAAPGRHAEVDAAVAAALAELARGERALGGEWVLCRLGGPPVAAAAFAALPGETRWLEAAVVDLGGGVEAARARVASKHRTAFHAAEHGLAFAEEPAALEAAHALHARQARAWPAHRPPPLELSRRLLVDAPAGPAARLFTLRDARGVLSAALVLDAPREMLVWWTGTHAEGRRALAFPRLLWGVVEWAAAHGRARVNLGASTGLAPVAAFKQRLGAEPARYPVRWLAARHAPPAGRAVAWLQARVRAGRPRGDAA